MPCAKLKQLKLKVVKNNLLIVFYNQSIKREAAQMSGFSFYITNILLLSSYIKFDIGIFIACIHAQCITAVGKFAEADSSIQFAIAD